MSKRSLWAEKGIVSMSALLLLGQPCHAVIASARATGMGQVAVAYPQDSLTAIYNPASAAEVEDRVDIGLDYRQSRKLLTLKDREPGGETGTFPGGSRGFIFPQVGVNKSVGRNWIVGFALYNYDRIYTNYGRVMRDFDGLLGTTNLRYEHAVEGIKATIARKISRSHSFGISLDLYGSRFKLDGMDQFLSGTFNKGHFNNNGYDYSTGFGATFGWIGHFQDCLAEDCLTLGLSYSPKVYMRRMDRYAGFFPCHGIDIPATLRIGTSYQCNPRWILATDLEYRWYSDLKYYGNHFPSSTPAVLFGLTNGAGLAWRDQWMVKVGLEYEIDSCLSARVGYRFEHLPYRKRSIATFLNSLLLKTVENILSAGATLKMGRYSECTVYGEYGFNNRVSGVIDSLGGIPAQLLGGNQIFGERYFTLGLSFARRF